MATTIRGAELADVPAILGLVNQFAAQNVMLPRSEESVRKTLDAWLVAIESNSLPSQPALVGCGALVPLTDTLVEVRSLAVHESQHGKGLGSQLVLALVQAAREEGYHQVCALTLRESFFTRLGFALVDRWSISPKVWQACIYCPKFHRCDEVAVLMNLVDQPAAIPTTSARSAGWSHLLKWDEWQPLRLAYQKKETEINLG